MVTVAMQRNPRAYERAQRTLGANMKRLRAELRLTQVTAGYRAGLHWRHYQKIEAGEVNICLSSLVGIAVALDTTIADLFLPEKR